MSQTGPASPSPVSGSSSMPSDPPPRSDTRSAITFRGLIEGSDDHQWIIADAIRDVDTGGQGGAPRHRWLIHTVTDGFSPLRYTARLVGRMWSVEAASPEQLAEAIRIQFPCTLRSLPSRPAKPARDSNVDPLVQRR